MYDNAALGTGGALAATGAFGMTSMVLDAVWLFLAGFAILSGVLALGRILPRRAA
jgi:hypothetical protein